MYKILVVDDNSDILQIVKILLTSKGYTVDAIIDPGQILDHIKSFTPDLILLDINIGLYDGRSICKDIKSNISIMHIPVLLFSALHGLEYIYKDCDATDFIAKPFTFDHLVAMIEKHLNPAA